MEGPISFWGYKEQESNLILPEHDDDDICCITYFFLNVFFIGTEKAGLVSWSWVVKYKVLWYWGRWDSGQTKKMLAICQDQTAARQEKSGRHMPCSRHRWHQSWGWKSSFCLLNYLSWHTLSMWKRLEYICQKKWHMEHKNSKKWSTWMSVWKSVYLLQSCSLKIKC